MLKVLSHRINKLKRIKLLFDFEDVVGDYFFFFLSDIYSSFSALIFPPKFVILGIIWQIDTRVTQLCPFHQNLKMADDGTTSKDGNVFDDVIVFILPWYDFPAMSTFSPVGSPSSDGLRMCVCVCLRIALA